MIKLILYQPDIPQNVGNILRLCACMGVEAHVVEPCGFAFDDKRMKRAGMDYLDHVALKRHPSWEAFCEQRRTNNKQRLILLTTHATTSYADFAFAPGDMLLLGRESAGAPQLLHETADARLCIPVSPNTRSLNIATAAAMVLGEALRQTGQFPSN